MLIAASDENRMDHGILVFLEALLMSYEFQYIFATSACLVYLHHTDDERLL
jgi:hypothetical protein